MTVILSLLLVCFIRVTSASVDMRQWEHHVAHQLADWNEDPSVENSMNAWRKYNGGAMVNRILGEGNAGRFSAIPIGAQQAVLSLAADVFDGIQTNELADIFAHINQMCSWAAKDFQMHVRRSSQLIFELVTVISDMSKRMSQWELVRHTPLANFLTLCRPTLVDFPLELVQTSIQSAVYRKTTFTLFEPNHVPTYVSSDVDKMLVRLYNHTPNDARFGLLRSVLTDLFEALFSSVNDNSSKSVYFINDKQSWGITLKFESNSDQNIYAITKALYQGLGRALALSIVLGVPIGLVTFSENFLNFILGNAPPQSGLHRELLVGFRHIIPADILKRGKVTRTELSEMWRGSVDQPLSRNELERMIVFQSSLAKSTIVEFWRLMTLDQRFRKLILKKGLGIANLPVGRDAAVYPPITVVVGNISGKSTYTVESTDETHHMISLV